MVTQSTGRPSPATRFGLTHLLRWLAADQSAGLGSESRPFSIVTMSSLPDGVPPLLPGALFIAVPGERRDGHDFVASAFGRGASAALVARVPAGLADQMAGGAVRVLDARGDTSSDPPSSMSTSGDADAVRDARPLLVLVDDPLVAVQRCAAWWRRQLATRVIAITGSVGKTTTKELLANILAERFTVLRTEGNLNNELGLPFMALRLVPDHQRAVLEVGISDVGEMATFAAIAGPDVAVVTRVAPAHLHNFVDLDTVEREKGRLVEVLRDDGTAILNADDARVARMARRSRGRVVFFGTSDKAAVRGSEIRTVDDDTLEFRLSAASHSEVVRVPLLGHHFVSCALAAAATALQEGCTWDEIATGLARPLETRRVRPRALPGGVTVIDDSYNASPAAMIAALDVLAVRPPRRVAVLGDMFEFGSAAPAAHLEVGQYVPGRADWLVTVGELGRIIADGARGAGMPATAISTCEGNGDAGAILQARLQPGDCVLVKGSRGMRMDGIVRLLAGEPAGGSVH